MDLAEVLKMTGSRNCAITGVRLQPIVRLKFCRLISTKYSRLCIPVTFEEIVIVFKSETDSCYKCCPLHSMPLLWFCLPQVQFLRKAVDVLCLCRNTLKYTYVFAFYLKKNNQSVIFEVRRLYHFSFSGWVSI